MHHPRSSHHGRGWDAWIGAVRAPRRAGTVKGAAGPQRPGRLLASTARHSAGWAILVAAASVAGAIAVTALPAVIGRAVDAALSGTSGSRWVAVCAGVVLIIVASDALEELATGASGASGTGWLRRRLARHVLAAGPRMSRHFQAGDVVSRMVGGTTDAGRAPAAGVMAITSLIPVAAAPVALVLIDPWIAAAFAGGLPLLALLLRAFMADTSRIMARYLRAQGAIAGRLLDALAGSRTIAAAGIVERESARVLAPLEEMRETGYATWRTVGRVSAQGTLLVPILQVVVLAAGGRELAAGHITPGGLLAASQYAVLGSGVGALIGHLNRLARAHAGATRALELMGVPPVVYGDRSLPSGAGRLELRGVTVRREGRPVLDDLDLVVPGGAVVAVVGRTGSGKSLLAALPGRLADPDDGQVLLDGVPVGQVARDELRRAVLYAFERPSLLGETVRDAIRFGLVAPPDREVELAAVAACADPFIRRLPHGYRTPLAAAPMSGGEVQRLGLARTFAHAAGARLMILDDATSSLDTATEMQVSRSLTRQLDLTRLIVAHRAATAARADLVAWLDCGRLRAFGPHHELWADPAYRAAFEPE